MVANRSSSVTLPAALLLLVLAAVGGGCAGPNPSFPLTVDKAETELAAMKAAPKRLDRPVVVIDGYLGIGLMPAVVAERLDEVTTRHQDLLTVALTWCNDFDDCRRKIIEAVDKAYPNDDPVWTREVDVIGISMGGLAARYAAADPEDLYAVPLVPVAATAAAGQAASGAPGAAGAVTPLHLSSAGGAADARPSPPATAPSLAAAPGHKPIRRLKIARLFTLSTPHRGATAAVLPALLQVQKDMRPGSAFLAKLDALRAAGEHEGTGYPIVAYGRVPDEVVGVANTAPIGQGAIWVPTQWFTLGHLGVAWDPRLVADVARRLRNEPSYAVEPLAPVP